MVAYTVRRLLFGALTAVLVSVFIFVALRIAPGDVALVILGAEEGGQFTEQQYRHLREELGLDQPLHVQYFVWMRDMVTLRWGDSLVTGVSVWGEMKRRVPVTLELVTLAMLVSTCLGIPLGVIMALKQDTWIDYVARVFSLAGLSMPSFWTATLVLLVGMLFFNWGPRLNYVSPGEDLLQNLSIFIWPAVCTAWVSQATKARMMRSTMLEVLRQDYIRTAHAKGLRNFVVVYRHALKNALIPVITIIGLSIAMAVSGSVIIETIFLLPGMGRYLVGGLTTRDYPVVQTVVLVFSIWVVLINLLVDVSYGLLDPRIRYD